MVASYDRCVLDFKKQHLPHHFYMVLYSISSRREHCCFTPSSILGASHLVLTFVKASCHAFVFCSQFKMANIFLCAQYLHVWSSVVKTSILGFFSVHELEKGGEGQRVYIFCKYSVCKSCGVCLLKDQMSERFHILFKIQCRILPLLVGLQCSGSEGSGLWSCSSLRARQAQRSVKG